MSEFNTIRAAKQFLADRIFEESKRQGSPLSKVEGKMLYFTESGWTLPDMAEVSAAFDRDCDKDAYEEKITGLVRSIQARTDRSEQEIADWDDAVLKLCDEDHYLLVLIDGANRKARHTLPIPDRLKPWLPNLNDQSVRMPGDRLRLILVAFAVTILVLVVALVFAPR